MLSKLLLTAASKNFGSNDIQIVPHWIIHSENKEKERLSKEIGHKIKKTANSDDLLGNKQLKLSFSDWCISILSSKKMSDANQLSGPLRKRKFTSTGPNVYCLWFVNFDPFYELLCFKVRCLWSFCDQNPTLIFQIFLIDFIARLKISKFRWGKSTEDSDELLRSYNCDKMLC